MAILSALNLSRYYNCEKDGYDLPGGKFISAFEMHQIDRQREKELQEIRDRLDAEMAYDPYNHHALI